MAKSFLHDFRRPRQTRGSIIRGSHSMSSMQWGCAPLYSCYSVLRSAQAGKGLMPGQSIKKVLITDLDNTLFDWVNLWYVCFAPMMHKIAESAGLDLELLKTHIKTVHQKHRTSEYAFLLEELQPVIAPGRSEAQLTEIFAPAGGKRCRSRCTTGITHRFAAHQGPSGFRLC